MNRKLSTTIIALLVALMMVATMFTAAVADTAATDTDVATKAPSTETTAAPTAAPTTAPTDEATDAPTAAPTTAPTDEATAAPTDEATKAPATGSTGNTGAGNTTVSEIIEAVEEAVEEATGIKFNVDALLTALGLDAASVTVTDTATIVTLDEATETYGGSVLAYVSGDAEALVLTSTYDAEVVATFADWCKTITDVDALNATEAFAEFVKNAKAVLADVDEADVDALLVAILNSDAEGVEIDEDTLALFFGEGVTGTVLGVYEQDGYEYCLLETETSVILGVRAI